jgi:23S rRNA pseudouridine955/2504/2580 synthase
MRAMKSSEEKPAARFVTAGEAASGQRLDNFLLRHLKGVPKSLVYRVLRTGEVRVNKGRVKPDYRVQVGDIVRLPPLRLPESTEPGQVSAALQKRLEGSILYEDNSLLVIDKPAGLAVHGGSGVNLGLIEALRQMRPQSKMLELVHRLDRETSGCLLVAKKRSALRQLQDALRNHQVSKTYIALVKGHWPKRKNFIESKLEKFELDSGERRVRTSDDGKLSRTEFKVLAYYQLKGKECSLLEAKPVTGRTHQIRVHAQSIGCPLVGDDKYCDDEFNAFMKKHGFKRLFLHAAQLEFPMPFTEDHPEPGMKTVTAEMPEGLAKPLGKLQEHPALSTFVKGEGEHREQGDL